MAITRPSGEQLRFESTNTGSHVLDTYLENAEIGGRNLQDLLGELFDVQGNVNPNIFQFRINTATYKLQVRIGNFVGTNTGYVDVPDGTFFRPTGAYQVGFNYLIHDLFTFNDSLYLVTANHTSGAVPDTSTSFVAVSGGTGKVPATATQLAGQAGKFLTVNAAQQGYELTSFTDSNVFYGFSMANNALQVNEVGLQELLADGALVQSHINLVDAMPFPILNTNPDPLLVDGFWSNTFTSGGQSYSYFDADMDGFPVATNDDLQAFANIINGSVTSGNYYNAWTTVIRPYLINNRVTRSYNTFVIPAGAGSSYKLYSKVRDTTAVDIDPDIYATWFLGNGNTEVSVVGNKLVVQI